MIVPGARDRDSRWFLYRTTTVLLKARRGSEQYQSSERGITFFDSAEAYGAANEEMLGEAVAPFRDKVVLGTKFGWRDGNPATGLDSSPARIRIVAEQSLKRLKRGRDRPCCHQTGGIA